jgi:LysM repeat protein
VRPSPTPRASAAPAPSGGSIYTVKAGDTLGAIAARFGTTATALAKLNGIADPSYIRVGQVLRLP